MKRRNAGSTIGRSTPQISGLATPNEQSLIKLRPKIAHPSTQMASRSSLESSPMSNAGRHMRSQTSFIQTPGVGDYEVEKSIRLVKTRNPQWSIYNSKVIKFPQSVVSPIVANKFPSIGAYTIPE